ncbi:biotin carboxylase N-terminal domain-containing protein [Lysinimonas soli]|uniref:biotin carboxylase n=1 Tax=Lysinimonas soli TaxID=1074233 RepID=A0ABW0NKC8_9MICO
MGVFETVLVANRGEIACRVIRTLRALGIRSIAVFSDADAGARHVGLADAAVRIGSADASDSYLNIERIVAAALAHGAQAIHPGYGFLAENAAFARACADAGIVFVGPGVEAIEIMGDKIRAKAHVASRGVPVVPGLAEPGLGDDALAEASRAIGFPVLIKPSAGGGGKGMHLVRAEGELVAAIAAARREAASSFGDDTLFVERYVTSPRHIEVQVLADDAGTTVHLGERECSLQRRHQKVVEEAPSILLDEATRARIGSAAVETARSVGYRGAGTVEFLVSADAPGEFFFMEMNTRLQVEHPVTELVTGLDLVEWQLRIAAGESLDFAQSDVVLHGHAVEARVYAEDPRRGFLPTGGTVLALSEPVAEHVRVDSALRPDLHVTPDYDPMLAKVIAWAPDRPTALRRLRAALGEMATLGVANNVAFLRELLADPDVVAGELDTGLIERRLETPEFGRPGASAAATFAEAALILHALDAAGADAGPWRYDGWRLGAASPARYHLVGVAEGEAVSVAVTGGATHALVQLDEEGRIGSVQLDGARARVRIGDASRTLWFARDGLRLHLGHDGSAWAFDDLGVARRASGTAATNPELRSPMPGSVVAVFVDEGGHVDAGTPVLAIEAMKMEHVLRAPQSGTVELRVGLGAQVTGDQVVASVVADAASGDGSVTDDAGTDEGESR